MPSTSKKQARFMAAAAHNSGFAKSAGIPVSVAKEFNRADTGKKVFRHKSGQFHHDPAEKGWTKP